MTCVQEWNVTSWSGLMKLAHHEAEISVSWNEGSWTFFDL